MAPHSHPHHTTPTRTRARAHTHTHRERGLVHMDLSQHTVVLTAPFESMLQMERGKLWRNSLLNSVRGFFRMEPEAPVLAPVGAIW